MGMKPTAAAIWKAKGEAFDAYKAAREAWEELDRRHTDAEVAALLSRALILATDAAASLRMALALVGAGPVPAAPWESTPEPMPERPAEQLDLLG